MSLKEWAEKEVEIAKEKERNDHSEYEFNYGWACYDSALKAFNSLLEDGHSGMSIEFTKAILDRLIDCRPLTPIYDTYDSWYLDDYPKNNDYINYRNNRMSSLFKKIYTDGKIKYDDVERSYCQNNRTGVTYHSALESIIVDELYPIKMPYMPRDKIKVVTEECLAYKKNGDFDTKGILYLIKNGQKVDINRYFAESQDYPDRKEFDLCSGWVEISFDEFAERMRISKENEVEK